LIENVQVSWVKAGPEGVLEALRAGVNDLGGTLMNESISRAAGAGWGQEMPPERMEALIRSAGRVPRQRTTLYGDPPAAQVARSFGAEPLAETWNPHVSEARLERPRRLCSAQLFEIVARRSPGAGFDRLVAVRTRDQGDWRDRKLVNGKIPELVGVRDRAADAPRPTSAA
jgi:hypothetical protein